MKTLTSITLIATLLVSTSLNAQENSKPKFSWGVHWGITNYTLRYDNVPVEQYRKFGFHGGFSFIHHFNKNAFVNIGLEGTDYKSPFENDQSIYDYYLRVPVLFSFLGNGNKNKAKNNFVISVGPSISALMQQGTAQKGEDYYTTTNSQFGSLIKYGLANELAWYTWDNDGMLKRSFGLRTYSDIRGLYTRNNSNINVRNNYITASLFYTIGNGR